MAKIVKQTFCLSPKQFLHFFYSQYSKRPQTKLLIGDVWLTFPPSEIIRQLSKRNAGIVAGTFYNDKNMLYIKSITL